MNAGEVLIRQKGFWYRPGTNVYVAKDWTIHASVAGKVVFKKIKVLKFNRRREMATVIGIEATA